MEKGFFLRIPFFMRVNSYFIIAINILNVQIISELLSTDTNFKTLSTKLKHLFLARMYICAYKKC